MSLSEALGPYPVIRHFYPIDPATASQQQLPVYNGPLSDLVAPILPSSSQISRDSPRKLSKKRAAEGMEGGALATGPSSKRRTRSRQRDTQSQQRAIGFPIRLARQRRDIAFVEIPASKSFDYAAYKPISLGPHGLDSYLASGQYNMQSPAISLPDYLSLTPSATPAFSAASDGSYDPNSEFDDLFVDGGTQSKRKRKAGGAILAGGTDGTTCHQCRRKNKNEKMKCCMLRPGDRLCTLYFCQTCMQVRYDEEFDAFHPNWRCPRCRGMCNCSLCLRKAGLGYVLDGPAAEELTGSRGRLSNASGQVKRKRQGKQPVSVRKWLARRGIALGTEEWIEEQRQRGVRFVVGRSPPPSDRPSPYEEARWNPILAACNDGEESDETVDGDGEVVPNKIADSPAVGDGSRLSSRPTVSTPGGCFAVVDPVGPKVMTTAPDSSASNLSALSSLSLVPAATSIDPGITVEDLPGLTLAETRHVKLIVGSSHPRTRKKRVPKDKVETNISNPKKVEQIESDSSDVETSTESEFKLTLPAILVQPRRFPSALRLLRDDAEEEKDPVTGPSPSPALRPTVGASDDPPTPPPPLPPSEPVLVPTEDYTPSKLDLTHVKDSHAQFGHSYWKFNAFNSQEHEHIEEPGSSSPFRETTLFSYTAPVDTSSLTLEDLPLMHTGLGPETGSTSMGILDAHHSRLASTSHIPDDYMTLHPPAPTCAEDGFATQGLSSFTELEETWATPGQVAAHMDTSLASMQMESAHRSVYLGTMQGGTY